MSQSTTVVAIAAHANGVPLIGKTKEYTPPVVEKIMDTVADGRFIESQRVKGYKLNNWSFSHEGLSAELAGQFNLTVGEPFNITFKESVEDSGGDIIQRVHEITGEIIKREKEANKAGNEDIWKTEGTADTYKLTINGSVIEDINVKTQKFVIAGKDIMSNHLDNIR